MSDSSYFKDVKRRVLAEGAFQHWKHESVGQAANRVKSQKAEASLRQAMEVLSSAHALVRRGENPDHVIEEAFESVSALLEEKAI